MALRWYADTGEEMGMIKRINMVNVEKVNADAGNKTNVGGKTADAVRKTDVSDEHQANVC